MVVPPPPTGLVAGLDVISLNIALVLGTAGLPHILIRFLTVPDAKTARSSIITATWIIGLFYLLTPVLGYGAALFVGQDAIAAAEPGGEHGRSAARRGARRSHLLRLHLGGRLRHHRGCGGRARRGGLQRLRPRLLLERDPGRQRFGAGAVPCGALHGRGDLRGGDTPGDTGASLNVAFLVALAFAVAASANVPVILLTIFWKRFNTTGAVTGILVGLFSCVVLIILSPNVMTGPNPEPPLTPIIPIDPIFPFVYPALFSVPLGVLGCILGTLLGGRGAEREREQGLQTDYDEIYVRSLTGISNIEQEIQESTPAEEPRTT